MKPAIIIRPQPACDATVAAARKTGLDAHGFPLFEVRPLPWEMPDPDTIDALLIGSANALRHGGAALDALVGKPAYAVGRKTAEAAREAGFDVVATGENGLQQVLDQIRPEHRRILRVAGRQRTELKPPAGINVVERIAYSSDPVPMPTELAAMLQQSVVVLIFSREAASHFASCCATNGIDRANISIAAIGARVARALGEGWQRVATAEQPNEAALLALAGQMCQEVVSSAPVRSSASGTGPMAQQSAIESGHHQPAASRSRYSQLAVVLLAFALGAAIVGWSAWRGYLGSVVPSGNDQPAQSASSAEVEPPATTPPVTDSRDDASELRSVSSLEARLAMLEDRLSRLNLQADAASGNAARAESLLIAFAARRMVDRGEPLRYLADQLKLRFANAQPRAVNTIIGFSQSPVTIDELTARLAALQPELTGRNQQISFWEKTTRELSSLFTVRRESSSVLSPEARLQRAEVMLRAGKISEAIAEVERLPGADAAAKWIDDARRYAAAQDALDLIETTAMLEPRRLQDSEGRNVQQPSPIARPAAPAADQAGETAANVP